MMLFCRRPLGADQRQRRGGGAPAGGGGDGGAAEAAAVAAPDAAGLRGARRLDAGADRHAGERAGARGLARRRARRASAISSSRCVGVPLVDRRPSLIALVLGAAAAAGAREPVAAAGPQPTTRAPWSSSSASTTGVHQLRVREGSPLIGQARDRARSRRTPGVTLVTVREAGGSGAARLGPIAGGRRRCWSAATPRRWRRWPPTWRSAPRRRRGGVVRGAALQPRLRASPRC